ncbi:MAG: hypothetical protein WKF76_01335 [Nocardioidaceae bacterium]
MRYLELRRHTDNDGDALTSDGVHAAKTIGAERLHPPYAAYDSSGATRASQMLEVLRHAAGRDDVAVTEEPGLRSSVEDRWRAAASSAGKGADVEAMRRIDSAWWRRSRPCSPPRCGGFSTPCPTAAGRSSSGTA